MTKRITAMLLAALMLVSFAGCKKNTDEGSGSIEYVYEYEYEYESGDSATASDGSSGSSGGGGTVANNGGTKTNTGTTNLEGNTYLSGFPIVKNQETLTIMCVTRADLGDIANSEFDKAVENLTNLKIEWQLVTESGLAQARTLALQADDMPDIMAGSPTDAEMNQYSGEGLFLEITKDMLNKWGPNIVASYNLYPEAWDITKLENGKMYSISGFTKDFPYGQHYVWVRKTWLSKLGLSMPSTMNDFYNMLVAFRDKDPNGNGQKDEIPYATWSSSGFFFNPWGFDSVVSVSNSGKVTHMYTTDNMKNALTFWNKVYKEDLVEKTTINNWSGNNAAFKTLISGGKVGAFFYGWPSEAMDEKLVSEYQVMEWPTSGTSNGDFASTYITSSDIASRSSFVISSKCKNTTAAIRFIDYLHTSDGYMLKAYGNVGTAYTKTSDTTYEFTGKSASENAGPSWALRGRNFLSGASITNDTLDAFEAPRKAMETWCESTIKSNGQKKLPTGFMTKNEVNQLKLYSTYFDDIEDDWYDYIKGTKSLSSDWTALLNEMKGKNLSKYLAVYQGYYDRLS